jgi:glycosyltransferase involved in cell wall biosynthesis
VSALHLAVYTDATHRGGAEVNLSRVLAALPGFVHVTVVGVDDEVVDWLCGFRPETDRLVLDAVRDRRDVGRMLAHRRAFRSLRPDVLQCNLSTASSCQWAIAAAVTIPGLPVVVVENSPLAVWSATSGRLKRLTARRTAAHVAVGERTARSIESSSGLPAGSIDTLYHGLGPVGREPVDRPDEPTLLCVARLDPVKGVDVLLEAAARVDPPTRFVVVGEGEERAALLDLRDRLGLSERVEFRSVPWDVRIADLVWAFDGFVLPSRVEGFPVTIVEAMLAGVPVVATRVGSVDEAVEDGVTGWIVPPEDPPALAAAVEALVADLDGARRRGDAGRERAEQRFTIERTIEEYLRLYRRLLGAERWSALSSQ